MMSDVPNAGWHVYDLIEVVEAQLHPDYATLSQVLAEADRLLRSHGDSAEVHYLRGYALYLLWDHGFAGAREARDEMDVVLRLDPSHQWALWCAIVLSARLGEDGVTIELFARLNRAYFADQGKDWRYLKAWEYALCSHLRLGDLGRFETGLKGLIQEFVKVAADPDEILERPNQVMEAYRRLRSEPGDLGSGADPDALVHLLEDQLTLLVPGGWIRSQELGPARSGE
jgi:hypothetical protein